MKLIKKKAKMEKYYYQNNYLHLFITLDKEIDFIKNDKNDFIFNKDKIDIQRIINHLKKASSILKNLSKKLEKSDEIYS